MRSLISIDFPAPKMEPESAHVVSAVSVHWLQCGDCDAAPPRQHSPILRYSALPRYSATPCYVLIQSHNVIDTYRNDDGVRKPSILHLPTSFPKQILTPSRVQFIEGSLKVKLPTIWTDEKQRWEESEKRRQEKRRSKRESLRRKKMQMREKVGKSRNTVFFQCFVSAEGRKVGLLKRGGCGASWPDER